MSIQLYEAGILGGNAPVVTPQTYTAAMLALTPQGFWKLDEVAGVVAADSSGNARDGVYVGAPTFGQPSLVRTIARSTNFNGSTQRVTVAPNVAFAPGAAFTMGVWKKSAAFTANSVLMGRGVTGGDLFVLFHNGGFGLWAAIGHAGSYEIADGMVVANDGFRHLYAMRWTNGGTVDLLVDGGLVASVPSVLALADPVASPLIMAGITDFVGHAFGVGDESCGFFLNYAISNGQFADLWTAGK